MRESFIANTMKYQSTFRLLSLLAVAAVAALNTNSTIQANEVTATWDGTTNNWTSATDWSLANYPDNGTPGGVDYSVVIDSSGTGPYTLTLDNSAGNSGTVNINSLTIDNSNATFDQTGGTLDLTEQPNGVAGGAVNVQAGSYNLNGGTLANATLTVGASGAFNGSGGILRNVTLGGNLNISGGNTGAYSYTNISNTAANSQGLNFSGYAVNIDGTYEALRFLDGYNAVTSQAVADAINGNINLIGEGASIEGGAGGLTIESGAAVTASFGPGGVEYIGGYGVTNNGVISATNGSDVAINPQTVFTNTGTVEASGASTLSFSGSWSNQGTIAAGGADDTVNFGGTFAAADVGLQSSGSGGTFTANGATVNITGTLDNTGNTLTFDSATGVWNLNSGGIIENGTLIAENQSGGPNSGASYLNISGGTLQNVTLGGNLNISGGNTGASTYTNISNTAANSQGLNFNGYAVNITGTYEVLSFVDGYNAATSQTFADAINGNVNLIGEGASIEGGLGGLTIDSGAAVTASFGPGSVEYIGGYAGITNDGIITATNGSYVAINPQTFTNNGIITAADGANIAIVAFTNNGTLALHNGTVTSTNLAVGSGMLTGSGTITGNVTLSSDPSTLAFNLGGETQGTQYDSLTINGNMTLAGNLELTLTNGFVPLAGDSFTVLTVGSGYALSGAFLDAANGGRLVDTNGTGSFLVNYGSGAYANEIVLTNFQAVPEPATLALLAIACAEMLLLKRRRASNVTCNAIPNAAVAVGEFETHFIWR